MTDPTQRFSNRVDDYVRYRPGYPAEILDALRARCGLTPATVVADLGSGTGLLARLFLDNGNPVFGVEPNPGMRIAGERQLRGFSNFTSIAATAEATTLPDAGIDLIVAGQAFHWFDQDRARAEFRRILRPGGWVALVWNERDAVSTPFLRAYERLLVRFATDYALVDHRRIDADVLRAFFDPRSFWLTTHSNRQTFGLAGVRGRLLSSSYAPDPGHRDHAPMLSELTRIFEECQVGGQVSFEYTTKVYCGQLV